MVERGQLVGLLTREKLFEALRERGENHCVAETMERSFQVARPDDLLEAVLAQTQPDRPAAIPVLQNGRIAGLLTPDNIGELYTINAALRARGDTPQFAVPPKIRSTAPQDVPRSGCPMASPLHD